MIQIAIQFIEDNWEYIITGVTAGYALFVKTQTLYYKLRYGSIKKMYQQIKTFKDDTAGLVSQLKETNEQLIASAKLTYELGRNANILKESKLTMKKIINTITDDVEDIPQEEVEEITAQQEVAENNKNISDILKNL